MLEKTALAVGEGGLEDLTPPTDSPVLPGVFSSEPVAVNGHRRAMERGLTRLERLVS